MEYGGAAGGAVTRGGGEVIDVVVDEIGSTADLD